MIEAKVNGKTLSKGDMICIVPSDGEVHLVFTRYGKDDCISFNTAEDFIDVHIDVKGEIPKNAHWCQRRENNV